MAEYIEREALVEVAEQEGHISIDDILEIPAADVAPVVRSEWELHKDGSGTCKRCRCTQDAVWDMDAWQNFCGHCGADMREVF